MTAFTDWAQVPLVCDMKTTAAVLNCSRSYIESQLRAGTMAPAPMHQTGTKVYQRRMWSEADLMAWVNGGHRVAYVARKRRAA